MLKIKLSELFSFHNYKAPVLDVWVKEYIFSHTTRKKTSFLLKSKYFIPVLAVFVLSVFAFYSLDYLNIWKPSVVTIVSEDGQIVVDDIPVVADKQTNNDSLWSYVDVVDFEIDTNIETNTNVADIYTNTDIKTDTNIDTNIDNNNAENVRIVDDEIVVDGSNANDSDFFDKNPTSIEHNDGSVEFSETSDDEIVWVEEDRAVVDSVKIKTVLVAQEESSKSLESVFVDLELVSASVSVSDEGLVLDWNIIVAWSTDFDSTIWIICKQKDIDWFVLSNNDIIDFSDVVLWDSYDFSIHFDFDSVWFDLDLFEENLDSIYCELDPDNLIEEFDEKNNFIQLKDKQNRSWSLKKSRESY